MWQCKTLEIDDVIFYTDAGLFSNIQTYQECSWFFRHIQGYTETEQHVTAPQSELPHIQNPDIFRT